MINKKLFVTILNNIRLYGGDLTPNNIFCQRGLALLQVWFPKDENGFCEIAHYCFFTNFGKENLESEYITPEMLYDKLIKIQKI
jgi:hypothetical protein